MKNQYDDISPNRRIFWLAVKWCAFSAALIAAFYFMILPMFVAGKVINREAQKFDAETSAQVYDNSRQFQQGVNRDIARYCREWSVNQGPAKRAVADLILTTTDTYQGDLTPANAACVAEIQGK